MKKKVILYIGLFVVIFPFVYSCINGQDNVRISTPEKDSAIICEEIKKTVNDKNASTDEIMEKVEKMSQLYLQERGGDECREFLRLTQNCLGSN
ncbi:MAG: hypothetical protein ACK5KL_00355 [Dysgonomonas sp.]